VSELNRRISGTMTLHAQIERWPLRAPFRISGYTEEFVDVLVITLGKQGLVGRGEAAGVYYKNDAPSSMMKQVEALRTTIESGLSLHSLQKLLPPGGARNAPDCALWDLESKLSEQPAWQLAGLQKPRPLLTTFTCGADEPVEMAERARAYVGARAIKVKLTGEPKDRERVIAVREAAPGAWLGVDANQGFTRHGLEDLMPTLVDNNVVLIERPFPIGQDALLEGFHSPILIAADESV